MASQIDIECPYCRGEITIDREWIGQKGECPYCNRVFVLSEPGSEQDKRTADTSHSLNKVADKSSFCGNSMMWKVLLLGIAVGSLIGSLIVLGFVFLWDSKSIIDGGHKGVQLWKDGPYWAETNIGAEHPWDYGYYFWWGDTIGYKRDNGAWVASNGSSSNFEFDNENVFTLDKELATLRSEGWIGENGMLTPEHDAAHVHWGGKWRMPTKKELEDLDSKCSWTWTTTNGISGYVIRGTDDYASASIFLPCTGWGDGASLLYAGSCGYYWSSVPDSDNNYLAWRLRFNSSDRNSSSSRRCYGQSVRPVQGFTK